MMTPWELFDLESAVDARGIKRRYAQLLKQYRPDDDPLAFQRLRDAYEYALEWVGRDQGEGTPEQAAERGGFYPISTDGLKRAENFRSCRATLRRIRGL
jgi:hypothetical protein